MLGVILGDVWLKVDVVYDVRASLELRKVDCGLEWIK
jgi:hypothetical protein